MYAPWVRGLGLTLAALLVLKSLHTGKRSSTGNQFVGELALVLLIVLVDITVSLVRFV